MIAVAASEPASNIVPRIPEEPRRVDPSIGLVGPVTRSRGSMGACPGLYWMARFVIWATRNSQ